MDNFSFQHVVVLLSTVMQQLVSLSRGSDHCEFLIDEVTKTLNYLSDYISNLRNS